MMMAKNWKLVCSRAVTESALDDIDSLFCTMFDWLTQGVRGWLKTREWKTQHQAQGRIQDFKLGGVKQRSPGTSFWGTEVHALCPPVGSRSKVPVGSLGNGHIMKLKLSRKAPEDRCYHARFLAWNSPNTVWWWWWWWTNLL